MIKSNSIEHLRMANQMLKRAASLLGCALLMACDVASNSGGGGGQTPDPVVVDLPIAFVERPLPVDEGGNRAPHNLLEPDAFHPGARLLLKARAQASAPEIDLTSAVFASADAEAPAPLYDVKDLAVSPDGVKLLFAMRAPEIENADEDEQPTWNIWEYDLKTETLRRIIASDINAEQGQDVAPAYLPDGRIVFSSTRQRRTRAILLDENRPQYAGLTEDRQQEAFVLHVMDADGLDIQQITFNQSHDLQPTVLDDGRIAFLRWDNVGGRDRVSLYTVNPDGSGLAPLYGYHSQNTGTNDTEAAFAAPQEMPDGRLLVNLRPRETERWGGDIVAINTAEFIDINQATAANIGAAGPAQESQAALPVLIDDQLSRHGYFNAATPLFDGTDRMLVSWSQCRVLDPETALPTFCSDETLSDPAAVEEADPLFGLWVYDAALGTQLPVVVPREGVIFTDPVVLAPRPIPTFIPRTLCDADCEAAGLGVVHIRSVYDFDGVDTAPDGIIAAADPVQTPVDERIPRFLRIVKPVPMPDDDVLDFDNDAFGVSANQLMREIVGYVPIEPDGSVKFTVPADIAFAVAVVDADGRRVGGRHLNWMSVKAGETLECNGCHTANSELPHGRPDAVFPSANPGAPFLNLQLLDEFGTPESDPELGETLAEYYSRLKGPRTPSMDMEFIDEWTDETITPKAAPINLTYGQIAAQHSTPPANCPPLDPPPPAWTAPAANCGANSWNSLCRTVIHYTQSIHPLWEADRRSCDAGMNVVTDNTCTSCHSTQNAVGQAQVPAGQLNLTGGASDNNTFRIMSYQELLAGDTELILDDEGNLIERVEIIETGEFETDEDGNLILDEDGQPIPITEPITFPVNAPMSVNGANASPRFFRTLDGLDVETVNHAGMMSPSELKLIAEWLDIGGQYYNDPFAVPAD